MKKIGMVLIASMVFLGAGVWTILNYCHGDSRLSFAVPVDSSKVNIDITTMGLAVWTGVPLMAIGLGLLAIAVLASIVAQFVPERKPSHEDSSSKHVLPLGD